MNLPDANDDKFAALSEDFNASAKKFARGEGLAMDGLMAKFDILWRFKAECPQDQCRLTQGLFEAGMDILRKIATPSCHEAVSTYASNAQQVFNFVTKPEYLQFLPDGASDQLVDMSLALIRKSEGVVYEYNWKDYAQHKSELITLARTIITYAEKTREPKPAGATFALAKTIPPVKRLTVSCTDGGAQ